MGYHYFYEGIDFLLDMLDCMYGPGSAEAIAVMGWYTWQHLCTYSIKYEVTP